MKRILVAALIAALAVPASAATTWAKGKRGSASAVATCTTGTEAAPSTNGAGLALVGIRGFSVHVEGAGAMTAGGKLLAYLFNPESGSWNPAPDLDLTVTAVAAQAFPGFMVAGGTSRIAFVPSGVGLAVVITIVGGS